MSFARWLLIHSFSIFIVTLFLLGYLYREELQLEQVYQQLLGKGDILVSELPVKRAPELESKSTQSAAMPAVETPEAEPKPISEPVDESPLVDDASIRYLQSTPTVARSTIELDDLLFKARKAYWDKDYQTAIFYYQQLIQDDGDNPDHIGELGNIYYAINDFENASQHYYQAAIILIARNSHEQAALLLSPLNAMNRKLGEQLRQKLMQH